RLLQRGYQRLMRYRSSQDGGFSGDCHMLFRGNSHPAASANALMTLTELQKLIYVDPLIIETLINYITSQQQADGTWTTSQYGGGYYYSYVGSYGNDHTSFTLHIAWALAEGGLANSAPVQRALGYAKENLAKITDAHAQAMLANLLLLSGGPDEQLANRFLTSLVRQSALDSSGERMWTYVSGWPSLDVTAASSLALVRSGRRPDEAQQALVALRHYLTTNQYYLSEPARPIALRALLLDAQSRTADSGTANVALRLNDADAATLNLNLSDSFGAQAQTFTPSQLKSGDNLVQLNTTGEGLLRYEVTSEYYVPWLSETAQRDGPFAFEVVYASKEVNVGGAINVRATIVNQTKNKTAPVIVELGVPAGYYPNYEDFQQMMNAGMIRGIQILDGKVVLNLDGLEAGQKIDLPYRLIANIPGSVPQPDPDPIDGNGHGSHVAGSAPDWAWRDSSARVSLRPRSCTRSRCSMTPPVPRPSCRRPSSGPWTRMAMAT
ncbi:MAG: hypothetical protein HC872_04795, partial [Gammaproteobacteria bacterium]|nr:hypothetical protein [Gammaproteobacteria bacterium]